MNRRVTAAVLTGTLALGGVGAGLVALPVLASATTADERSETDEEGQGQAESGPVGAVREALEGLVSDGTIDEAQADAVAEALGDALAERRGGGPGGHGGHGPGGPGGFGDHRGLGLDVAATTLGVSEDELRTALADGESLASVAEAQGVSTEVLVDALVAAAEEHLAEHVADGDLTQEQADERSAALTERITELVEREGLPDRPGRGGHGAPSPDGATEGASLTT
jgi:hypothetical protein